MTQTVADTHQHIDMLTKKHAALEAQIHEESKNPQVDDAKVHHLKREKLLIRDKIVSLTS